MDPFPVHPSNRIHRPPRPQRAGLHAAAWAMGCVLGLAGCSALADLDGYAFGRDAGAARPEIPETGVTVTAGSAELRGTRYGLSVRFGAPQPMRRLPGDRLTLVLGPSTPLVTGADDANEGAGR